jgi:hypothetical protein
MHVLTKDQSTCFSDHNPRETILKSIPFKVVLSWKQCSCDVITGKVYSIKRILIRLFCLEHQLGRHGFCWVSPWEIESVETLYKDLFLYAVVHVLTESDIMLGYLPTMKLEHGTFTTTRRLHLFHLPICRELCAENLFCPYAYRTE